MTADEFTVHESTATMPSRDMLVCEWKSKLSRLNRQRLEGEVWCLVDKGWFEQFEKYMGGDQADDGTEAEVSSPGKIQNHGLLDGGDQLEKGIDFPSDPDWQNDLKPSISEADYVALPPEVWEWLHRTFGGGPCIPRYCLEAGVDNEVFDLPITVYIILSNSKRHAKLRFPSRLEFDTFRAAAEDALKIPTQDREKYHIVTEDMVDLTLQAARRDPWPETLDSLNVADSSSLEFTTEYDQLTKPSKSDVIQLGPARKPLQLDVKSVNTTPKPLLAGSSALSRRPILSPIRAYEDSVWTGRGRVPGLAGLQNLGNTCFMNSALQCLFHCVPVLNTFLSGAFNEDLNEDNPLGKGGEMATAFGSLLQKVWRGEVDYVNPEGFKHILGKHAVQFQSYEQHDSQEFLSYLLDMLHEDLNRVKKKPYIEEADDEGRPDEELAKESWDTYRCELHMARNDSAIVDNFQGLLKSTLDCPNCGHHKRKFDPFMYLSVPLPGTDTILREVTVVPMDGVSKPQLYCIKVFKNDTVGAFIEAMAILLSIQVDNAQQRLQAASVSSNNKVTVLDNMTADLPHKTRWSSDRLVVYSYPEVAGEEGDEQPSKRAVIMPPGSSFGSKCPLPLLLRVPGNAIELETESTGMTMYRSSNKRYLLRPDCELARRVEDLLKPFKRLRSGSNLVYSPAASSPGQDAEDSEMAEGGGADDAGAQLKCVAAAQGVAEGSEHGGRRSPAMDRDGDSPMLSADTDTAVHGSQRHMGGGGDSGGASEGPETSSFAMDAVDWVATATGAFSKKFSIESPGQVEEVVGGTPSWLMDTCSGGAGAVAGAPVDSQPGHAMDTVQGIPADEPIEATPCSPSPVNGLLGGHESEQTTAVPAPAPAPPAPPPPSRAETYLPLNPSSILGAVPAPEPLDRGGSSAVPPAGETTDAGMDSVAGAGEAVGEAAEHSSKKPAVRLLAVTEAGFTVGVAPQADAETRFFKLDVPTREAVGLFDVEAMSQVERHDSMAQLEIRNEYSLEDCIKAYLASEVLGPSDTWHCPKCRQDVRAKKALDLWCLSEVLIIHLKRFSYSGSGYYATMSSKIDNLVDFPLEGLDMTNFVHAGNDQAAVYDCFGVSNHFGSVSGGHYTAYCAHERSICSDGQKSCDWNCYNDRSVATTTPAAVVTSSAYVLFYRRRSKSEADPNNLVQQCKDELQKNYLAQAAEALGEEPAAADVPRTSSPSTSTDVNEPRAARATLGDGLVDSPLKASLPAVFSPPRLVDESMSGGEPNTPEPNAISLNQPIPIASSHSDTVPPPEETEMKTFGMSTSVRMEQAFPGISDFGDKGIASDIADLSDAGEAPPSGDHMQLSIYSQGAVTSEDGNDGAVKDSVVSDDDDGPQPASGGQGERVHAWLQENAYNDQ